MPTDEAGSRALKKLVQGYIAAQGQNERRYTQAKLAKDIGYDPAAVSKYISGKLRPPEAFLETLFRKTELLGADVEEHVIRARVEEILRAGDAVRKDELTFANFQAHAAAFDFWPFLNKEKKGFTPKVLERLFRLANIPFQIELVSRFGDMFARVDDPNDPHTMVLHVSDTIPRSKKYHTFHTPVAAPLNIIVPIDLLSGARRDAIREKFLNDDTAIQPFFAVREEIGYSYLTQVLTNVTKEKLSPIDAFDPMAIAKEIREIGIKDGKGEPRLFIGDEFLCLQVAKELESLKDMGTRFGFLFPLGTMAVARSDRFAKIPTYKYGLFSVPRQLEDVIRLLTTSLNTLFDNERFFVALAYKSLAEDLTTLIRDCVLSLSHDARKDLKELHKMADEHFQSSATSAEFANALAARVTRQAMRLNTHLIDTDEDLNLRWRPVLELVRHRLLGPLRADYRDLRFDQAVIRCRVFPPFLETEASDSEKGPVRIKDWGLFGPVLSQLSDLVNLPEHEAASDTDGPFEAENPQRKPSDLTVGIFDVSRRAQDAHLFRFPTSFRLNALYPSSLQSRAVDALKKLLSADAALHREAALKELRESLGQAEIVPIVLQYTAAHYQCWHWDYVPKLVTFDLRDYESQARNFSQEFRAILEEEEMAKPVIIADDLTCFRVSARLGYSNVKLLFPAGAGERRTRYFHSIAVRRSPKDEWWSIMREMLPAAVAKSERELVDKIARVRREIRGDALKGCAGKSAAAKKWLDEVFCLDLVQQPGRSWKDDLLSRAWQPVLEGALQERK